MWIENNKLTSVEAAIKKGKTKQLDQILAEILNQQDISQVVQTCPQCHKDLIHKGLPYLEIFVNACPDNHGAWMSPDANRKFQEFLSEQISIANQRRYQIRVLTLIFGIVIILMLAVHVQRFGPQLYQQIRDKIATQYEGRRINAGFWPERNYANWYPLPVKESPIDHIDELTYFKTWMGIIESGATNRLNVHQAMSVTRPKKEYIEIAEVYLDKQEQVLHQLMALTAPSRLEGFHAIVIQAARHQMDFINGFAQMKYENPRLNMGDVLDHPDLQESNRLLWRAYYTFRDTYPDRDQQTNDAIEQRLCLFDLI